MMEERTWLPLKAGTLTECFPLQPLEGSRGILSYGQILYFWPIALYDYACANLSHWFWNNLLSHQKKRNQCIKQDSPLLYVIWELRYFNYVRKMRLKTAIIFIWLVLTSVNTVLALNIWKLLHETCSQVHYEKEMYALKLPWMKLFPHSV